jgi:diadenylate cyclase
MIQTFLFDIGFLNIRFWDIVDILVVGYLIYLVYRLLRGSVAFNIFVGVVLLYTIWWLVKTLKMELLSMILGQFVSVGVVIIAIVFQPELRRFLLLIGNQTLRGRLNFINPTTENRSDETLEINELYHTIIELGETHTGALIVLANKSSMFNIADSGVKIEAKISKSLILSIFNKESPLHDGAIIIANNKILAASSVLPLSESPNLPQEAGLRHRAALGISETANVTAFIVSEENGRISMAHQGHLKTDLDKEQLLILLEKYYK